MPKVRNMPKRPKRPKICSKHSNREVSCEDCAFTERQKVKQRKSEEKTARFNTEFEFLRSLPEDEAARNKIIKTRATMRSVNRASAKLYRGPALKTKEDREAEEKRIVSLNSHNKIEAARRSEIQRDANIANLKLEIPNNEAKLEDLIMKKVMISSENNKFKQEIDQKLVEIRRLKELKASIQEINLNLNLALYKTGNGN